MAHNNFIWHEINTTDAPAAQAFYTKVAGLTPDQSGGMAMPYARLMAGDQAVVGIPDFAKMHAPIPDRASWIGYIGVDDVDATAQILVEHGGTITKPPADGVANSRFAGVADPHGVEFKIFQRPDAGPVAPIVPGQIGWSELHSGNLDEAWPFYSAVFGWEKSEAMDMGPMGKYQIFAVDGAQVGAIMTKPPQMPMPLWVFYIYIDDIDAAASRVRDNGGTVLNGPMEVPGGSWVFHSLDPQGAMFGMSGPKLSA